jgi:hypothetical protein
MTKMILAFVIAAGSVSAATALGAPREQVTFLSVPSSHALNDGANAVRTATFAGADGGGAYEARVLRFSGQWTRNGLTTSDPNDSMVLVTPPSGTPFIAVPAPIDSPSNTAVTVAIPADSFVIPVSAIATAGTWTFQFFQRHDTAGADPDATWDSISVTMDDAPAPFTPLSGTAVASLTNALVDRTASLGPMYTYQVNLPAGTPVSQLRVRGLRTATSPEGTGNLLLEVTPPGGSTRTLTLFSGTASSQLGEGSVGLAATVDSGAGPWTIGLLPSLDGAGTDAVATQLSLSFEPVTPPAATDVALVDGSFVTSVFPLAQSEIKWLTFNLPAGVDAAAGSYLDIDAVGSTLTPQSYVAFGLYSAAGFRVAADDVTDGSYPGELTFGKGVRDGGPGRLAFNGRDGSVLAADRYYLAVSSASQPAPSVAFGASAPAFASGTAVVRMRYGSHHVPVPPSSFNDWAVVGLNQTRTDSFTTAPYGVRWYRFSLSDVYHATYNRGLEIDTDGSMAGGYSFGLYGAAGGPPIRVGTQNGGAIPAYASFGIDNRVIGTSLLHFTGGDGPLTPGVYYIGIKMGGGALSWYNDFVTENLTPTTGDLRLNVRTFAPSVDGSGNVAPAAEDVTLVPGTVSRTASFAADGQLKWYRFTLPADAADDGNAATTGTYLDIDDTATTGAVTSSTLALYTPSGFRVALDFNGGGGQHGVLSFGDKSPARARAGDGALLNNGRHGLLPAGTYYAAVVSKLVISYPATTFPGAQSGAQVGSVVTRFTTNISAPTGCGPADLGSQGGVAGFDHILDNNDFVVFIDYFFAHDARADFGVQGGQPGADGQFDNNDFIVFIDSFFAGCP